MSGEILIDKSEIHNPAGNYRFAGFNENGRFVEPEALVCVTGGVYEPIKDAQGNPAVFREVTKEGDGEQVKFERMRFNTTSFAIGSAPYASEKEALGHGGKYRAVAVARLAEEFPLAQVFTGAKYANLREAKAGMPTHATIYRDHLIALGVKPERIIAREDDFAVNTFTELISEILALAESNARLITFCTNAFHQARLGQMLRIILNESTPNGKRIFENFKNKGFDLLTPELLAARRVLKERNTRINIVAAEPVLLNIDAERHKHTFANIFALVYQAELAPEVVAAMGDQERQEYEKRLVLYRGREETEAQGLSQLLDGTYTPIDNFTASQ